MSEEYRAPRGGGTDCRTDCESAVADRPLESFDVLFEAMADPRRRRVLEHLRESSGAASVSELADALASRGDESVDRDEVEITLLHAALPKLAALGLVEYDADGGTVELESGPLLDVCLELVAQAESGRA